LRFLSHTEGRKVWLHWFLTVALHGGQWTASHICPFTLGNELVPSQGKPVGSQSTFWLFGNYINVLPLRVKTVVQSAARSLHKLHRRDALNHPVATVLFAYHYTDKCVATNRGSGTLHTSNIFRASRNIRNTNLQRMPGQTVWISVQSSCTVRCHNVWSAPPDPLGGNANPSQISQQLFEARPDFMWQFGECDLFGITARITFSPYRAAHWWRHHSAPCDCPVCRRQLQELNRHPASESFILQGTWAFRGRSRKDADTRVWC
jgi:hypothetical protein